MKVTRLEIVAIALTLPACQPDQVQTEGRALEMAADVQSVIEQHVGLPFKEPPDIAVRTREQIRAYLDAKIETDLPPDELERLSTVYRLFGLIPDTLDVRRLLSELYFEQVMGYYDPDSVMLFLPADLDPAVLRFTLSHELVHALQDQYMPVTPLLSNERGNDRRIAAQAVLEGQATLVATLDMLPDRGADMLDEVWSELRVQMRDQQGQMPVLAAAPAVIREGLIFPYLTGADFVRWFGGQYPDTVPYGPRLPQSTEQILHPDRYRIGDMPTELAFVDSIDAFHEDGFGQFEIGIFLTELTDSETTGRLGAMGWDGDRYAVLEVGDGYGVVWWSVWDNDRAADRFAGILQGEWPDKVAPGRRYVVERFQIAGLPGVLFMYGPSDWEAWNRPPEVTPR
ncbi:MAG: hypothetical protein JSW51_06330 [Gemmatimonadota bacterium]|nr:MAG: hypothetical protein JSW51_06330 [Gemmatimonadota bacterium]